MFSKPILQKRLERAYSALREFDVDVWIILGRETHFTPEPSLMYLLPAAVLPLCALVITKTGESVCIVGALDAEEIETYGAVSEVVSYRSDFEIHLTDVLKRYRPAQKIALNYSEVDPSSDGLSYTQYKRVMRCLDKTEFKGELISACNIMKRVRAQKSPEEIAGIERTVLTAMNIYDSAKDFIRSGVSGADIQHFFQSRVHELNADYSWPKLGNPFVSIGTRSSYLCKRPPTDIYAQPGDLINVDFGLRIDGFGSDNQRSFYVLRDGENSAPEEVRSAFEAVKAAICAAVDIAAPGIYTTVTRDKANEIFVSRGYPAVGGLGHEMGTFAHEGGVHCGSDYAIDELDCFLETGMVFTMEPAIITSHGRLCQEEDVVITDNGCRFLSIPQKEVWLVK
ncbi:MAG: M24 family metallopeptidase [Chloroflexi bacterium]|nr:M24 family metallopeptidase [Chloroflexota bacterium]